LGVLVAGEMLLDGWVESWTWVCGFGGWLTDKNYNEKCGFGCWINDTQMCGVCDVIPDLRHCHARGAQCQKRT